MKRRLAAILAADLAGYSRMIRADEEGTLAALNALRAEVIDPQLQAYRGRTVKLMGDGMLVEFASVVDAVRAAAAIQAELASRNAGLPPARRMDFRVGINLGDVVVDGDDLQGDGVNVAARLESLADPGGICISDAVHEQVRDRARLVFDDMGLREVKNIDRPLRVWRWLADGGAGGHAGHEAGRVGEAFAPRLEKPSIAVLPFDNMSGDPEQTYFSDGITDDIITELSRYNELLVIARHSSFAYRGRPFNAREIAQELAVQYIVEGSIRRAGQRVRVTAQLIDATAGSHLWAERYDRGLEDIFAVQDEITAVIVNTLVGQVTRQHHRRALAKGGHATDAYDHTLRAMELLWKVGPRENLRARAEAELAVGIDPRFARAHAFIAWTHVSEGSNLWGDDPARSFQQAHDAAVAAVASDDREPWAHAALGWAHIWRDRAHQRGLAALSRAIALNPSNAHFRSMYAWGLGYAGKAEDALREMEVAMRLNPHHPVLYHIFLGRALFHLRRFDEALIQLERVLSSMAMHSHALALTAACYAAAGRIDDAESTAQMILRASPGYTLRYVRDKVPYANSEDLEFYVEMLRVAGLPD